MGIAHAWTEKTDWMRAVGATVASWSESGELLTCTLGDAPAAQSDEPRETPSLKREVPRSAGAGLLRRPE